MGTDLLRQLGQPAPRAADRRRRGRSALGADPGPAQAAVPRSSAALLLVIAAAAADAGRLGAGAPSAADGSGARGARRRTARRRSPREMRVDPLELELASDLVDLVDAERRRRPARPGARPAPQARPRARHRRSRRCAPATTSTCRRAPTRSGCTASRWPAARRRPARVLAIGDDLGALPGTADPRAGLRARRQVGAAPSCASRPSSPAPPSSTGPR